MAPPDRRGGRGGGAASSRDLRNNSRGSPGLQNEETSNAVDGVDAVLKNRMKSWKEEGEIIGLTGGDLAAYVMKEKERFREREERQAEREREERQAEREREERQVEREYKIREMEIQAQREIDVASSRSRMSNREERDRRVKIKLPCFEDGEDLESFLWQFERAMKADEVPDDEWSIKLTCLLKGKARKAVTQMKHDDVDDYAKLKKELLKKFRLTSEEYRGKLKHIKKRNSETARELMARIEQYTDRWVELSSKELSYESMRELFIVDIFVDALPKEQAVFVKDKRPTTLDEATEAAETYDLSRQSWGDHASRGGNVSPTSDRFRSRDSVSPNRGSVSPTPKGDFSRKAPMIGDAERNRSRGHVTFNLECYNCGGPHKMANCQKRTAACCAQVHNTGGSGSSHCCASAHHHCCGERQEILRVAIPQREEQMKMSAQKPLCEECSKIVYHPSCKAKVEGIETSALRDTGATISVVDVQLVPQYKLTGETRPVTLASNECRRVPVARVYMETPFFKGEADVLVMESPV
jgi:hypothetical protein